MWFPDELWHVTVCKCIAKAQFRAMYVHKIIQSFGPLVARNLTLSRPWCWKFFTPQIIKRYFCTTHKFLAKTLQKIVPQKLFLNLWTYIILPFRGKLSWLGPSIKDVSNSEGGRGYGSKLVENCWWIKVKTYMTTWGRGLSKNRGKNADVFYGWSQRRFACLFSKGGGTFLCSHRARIA